jgi:hypothetical protein
MEIIKGIKVSEVMFLGEVKWMTNSKQQRKIADTIK